MRRFFLGLSAALVALTLVAAPVFARSVVQPAKASSDTIVGIVLADDGEFDILQAAVIKAGLVDALNGTDKYTVFAPTDAAFVSTFSTLLDASLTEADVIDFINAGGVDSAFGNGALANILLYHVEEGRHFSNSVLPKMAGQLKTISTLNGGSFQVSNAGVITTSSAFGATIVAANIPASNGVIHVINAVLLP
ncbi:MAG: fasciclin domain-containing protein [Chloroflexota bacterium]